MTRVRRLVGRGLAIAAVTVGVGWAVSPLWRAQPLNTKAVCVYTGDSITALDTFSRLVGRPVNCVVLFNDANAGWAQWIDPWFTHRSAGDAYWTPWLEADPATRRVVVTQEMVPDDVPANWRELGAAGTYDGYARRLAANLVAAGMGHAVIRLGHEMNGTWYHDSLGSDPSQYRAWAIYWARIVRAMRSVPGAHFLFDWNVNAGYRDIPLASYYPGDSVVDVIGADIYDAGMPGNPRDPAARWASLSREPGGLAQLVAFAREHGKPLSFPEWGLVSGVSGGLGDDPAYVRGIAVAIKDNPVLYQAYFDRAVNGVILLQDAPRSMHVWEEYFGPRGSAEGRPW